MGVLNGAFMFLADLVRHLSIPCQICFMQASSYKDQQVSTGEVTLMHNLDLSGKNVLIVEDIFDTGLTLKHIREDLNIQKPASLEICALLNKRIPDKVAIDVRYIGFEIENPIHGFTKGYRNEGGFIPAKGQISICGALIETDDEGLESFLNFMETRGTINVEKDNYYMVTDNGHEVYQDLVKQLQAYVMHFEIYAYVDLERGIFGDPESDLLEGEKWHDLRVAVAEYKGIDPYRVVFLAMLSAEKFYENPDWKFDLSMGTLFQEMEQLVMEQLHVDDLGYSDSNGQVSGEEAIQDIIKQGSELVLKRKSREQDNNGRKKGEESPDEQVITTTYYW